MKMKMEKLKYQPGAQRDAILDIGVVPEPHSDSFTNPSFRTESSAESVLKQSDGLSEARGLGVATGLSKNQTFPPAYS